MKKKAKILITVAMIAVVTAVLVILLPGSSKEGDSGEAPPTEAVTEVVTTEQRTVTESTEIWIPQVTEEPTTEEVIDGSGFHKGKLGSTFEIPEGFRDVSPKDTEDGYFFIYENPEYQMTLQVAEFRMEEKDISFDVEYTVLHNRYKADQGTTVTWDKKEDDHYVISGFTEDRSKVFYIEGFKHPDRNEVQIYSLYPNDSNKTKCDTFLELLQDTLQYNFVSDPGRNTEEKNSETE